MTRITVCVGGGAGNEWPPNSSERPTGPDRQDRPPAPSFLCPRPLCHVASRRRVFLVMPNRKDAAMTALAFDRRGSGAPLVLLPGLGSSRPAGDPVAPALAGYVDVLAVDLPGLGDSPP